VPDKGGESKPVLDDYLEKDTGMIFRIIENILLKN